MATSSEIAAKLQKRRRWLLLGMLVLLHLTILEGVPSPISVMLVLGHTGLFFLWQPFVRAERRLEAHQFAAIVLLLAALVAWFNWWLLIVWVMLIAGIIGGKVFLFESRSTRLFYLLALGYLLAVLLVILVPAVLPPTRGVGEAFELPVRYLLPLVFVAMALLPKDKEAAGQPEVVDFAYSLFVILALAVMVLGAVAAMMLRGSGYIESLLQVVLIFAVALLFLAWIWDPRAGFSGIGAIFSRYMLTIGMPFEQWVHALSEYAQRDDDPEEFLGWACEELIRRIPWVVGGRWQTDAHSADFGSLGSHRSDFHEAPLSLTLHTRHSLSPALAWHLHVVTQLLAEFYRARLRARKLRQLSYLEAIYETGARLTHDVKNLLQSLNALCFAAARNGAGESDEFQGLMRRQLPAIAQRLQQTLDKLQSPVVEDGDLVKAADWWEQLVRRYDAAGIEFRCGVELAGRQVPSSLFSSAAENLLQNALDKRGSDPQLGIVAELSLNDAGLPVFGVADTGAPVPQEVVSELGRGPVRSDNGLGIGLYQACRYAELMGYVLCLISNQRGQVSFRLAPVKTTPG